MTLTVDDVGRIILPAHASKEQARAFLAEFEKTPEGREVAQHLDADFTPLLNSPTLAATIERTNGAAASLTLSVFCSIVRTMIITRDPSIFPPEVPAAPDTRPRNADGTFKSEFQVFADSHAMNEIRARATSDRAFGDWFRQQVQAQITTPGVFKVIGAPPERTATQADRARLETFARAYARTSIDVIRRPIAGYITLTDGSRFTVAEVNNLVTECSRVGLI